MGEWGRLYKSGHGSLEITIEVNAFQKKRTPTTDFLKVLVSQLLGVKLGVGGLLWGGHGFCCDLHPAWPNQPGSTSDSCPLFDQA